VTVENHNILGGLGGAVAEVLSEHHPVPIIRIGVRDRFGECGETDELFEKFQMSEKYITNAALKIIERKNNA